MRNRDLFPMRLQKPNGDALAMNAYGEGTLPFPDGAILAMLACKHAASAEADRAFGAEHATTLQFMVENSQKYGSKCSMPLRLCPNSVEGRM